MTTNTESVDFETDGRRVRGERSRALIARAMLDLVRETRAMPTMETVADRANVSRRSVFRHYADTSELLTAAFQMQRAEVFSRFKARDLTDWSQAERVRAFAQRAGRLYEYVAAVRGVAIHSRDEHPILDTLLREDDTIHRTFVISVFSDELEAVSGDKQDLLLSALISASAFTTWQGLRRDQRLSVLEARRVTEHSLLALLALSRAEAA
jgi:AcrR family transcriptional regulator